MSAELNAQIITVSMTVNITCTRSQKDVILYFKFPMCGLTYLPTTSFQALYDYVPSENDLQPLLAWLAVMEKAHVHLSR